MFANAKQVKTDKPAAKKDKKDQVNLPGLTDLASIDAVIKALTALKSTIDADIKSEAAVHFVKTGRALKKRPENFRGVDEGSSASIELRIRSTTSVLSEEEQALLAENGIGTRTVVSVVDTYVINPDYKDNAEILGLVESRLAGVEGIPEDFIQKQDGVSKVVVAEDALDKVFTLSDEKARDLLSVVGVLAVKPKLDTTDISAALKAVGELLGEGDAE